MDTTFSFTAIDTFQHNRNIDDTIGWTTPYAHFGSIDWNTNGDTAVFMGTNFEFWDPHFITKTNASTFVHCVNSNNGNQHWPKTFSNGYSHLAHSVIRLPGNKHLLVFNEYNWDKYPGENLAIHLILIDEYGNPIGINEQEEEALLREPVVFPNPASHLLWVKNLFWSGNSYHYYLNDLSGKTVQKGKLAKGEPITLKEELRGIYVLSIVNQTGFGWARKILIN